jgi:hypothetical protein
MLNFFKKLNVASWLAFASVLAVLVAVIIFLINSTTGYLAGQPVDMLITLFSFLAAAVIVCTVVLYNRFSKFADIGLAVAVVFLIVCIVRLVLIRTIIFEDVYFIPVNYPKAQGVATIVTIVAAVFYLISLGCLIASSFFKRLTKEN